MEENFDNSFYCSTFATQKQNNLIGALVQLVRIHACHAWGHGFESRTHRKEPDGSFFCVYTLTRDRGQGCSPKAHQATQSSPVRTARNLMVPFFVCSTLTRDRGQGCSPKAHQATQSSPVRTARNLTVPFFVCKVLTQGSPFLPRQDTEDYQL